MRSPIPIIAIAAGTALTMLVSTGHAAGQGRPVESCPRVRPEQQLEFDRVVEEYAAQGQTARFFAMTLDETSDYLEALHTARVRTVPRHRDVRPAPPAPVRLWLL